MSRLRNKHLSLKGQSWSHSKAELGGFKLSLSFCACVWAESLIYTKERPHSRHPLRKKISPKWHNALIKGLFGKLKTFLPQMTWLPAEAAAALCIWAFRCLAPASAISEQLLVASLMRLEKRGGWRGTNAVSIGILCFGNDKRRYLFRQHLCK